MWVGQHTGIFKIRLGVGEIEGRDRDTEIQKDRADNKDPKKSLIAQLVYIYKRLRPRKKICNRKKERATETLKMNTKKKLELKF